MFIQDRHLFNYLLNPNFFIIHSGELYLYQIIIILVIKYISLIIHFFPPKIFCFFQVILTIIPLISYYYAILQFSLILHLNWFKIIYSIIINYLFQFIFLQLIILIVNILVNNSKYYLLIGVLLIYFMN